MEGTKTMSDFIQIVVSVCFLLCGALVGYPLGRKIRKWLDNR